MTTEQFYDRAVDDRSMVERGLVEGWITRASDGAPVPVVPVSAVGGPTTEQALGEDRG